MFKDDMFKDEQLEKLEAQRDLTLVEAALVLISNNTLGCELHIGGMRIGLCNNDKIKPALLHHKEEIEKFLRGEESEWL
jgi:hypothetical protein